MQGKINGPKKDLYQLFYFANPPTMHARYWDKFEPNIPQRTRDPDDIEQSILDGVREIEAIEKGGFHVCVCVCARALAQISKLLRIPSKQMHFHNNT